MSTARAAANGATSPRGDEPSSDAPSLRRSARAITSGLLFYAAAALVGAFLSTNAVLSGAVQALLAEWGAGRAGVEWTRAPREPSDSVVARVLGGAALGLAVGAFAIVVALVTRAATLERTAPAVAQSVLALLTNAIGAVRDELLLRGFLLTAVARWITPAAAIALSAIAGAAASFGAGHTSAGELLFAAVTSTGFAALWIRDRGAWKAVGAHAALFWALGSLARGGLIDVRWKQGLWGGGDAGSSGSMAVVVVLAIGAALAVAWSLRGEREPA